MSPRRLPFLGILSAAGLFKGDAEGRLPPSTEGVIEKNQVTGSAVHGIQVNPDAGGVVLLQNYLQGNGDDGIHVKSVATTITKNTAVYNADLGISAPSGVTDGGGNKASGNGNAARCTGVVCGPAF